MRRRGVALRSATRAIAALVATSGLSVAGVHAAYADSGVTHRTELPFTEYGDHVVDVRYGQVFVSGNGEDDPLAVTDLSGDLIRTVPELTGAHRLALSPNGSSLFVSIGEEVLRLDPVTLEERDRYLLEGITWIDDLGVAGGKVWVSGGSTFRYTYTVGVGSGEIRQVRNDGGTFYSTSLTALPAQRVVAVVGHVHEPRVSTLDARTGDLLTTRTFPSDDVLGSLQATPGGQLACSGTPVTTASPRRWTPGRSGRSVWAARPRATCPAPPPTVG